MSYVPPWLEALASISLALTTTAAFITLVIRWILGLNKRHVRKIQSIVAAEVEPIRHELSPNSGSSLRDQTDRIEAAVMNLQSVVLTHVQDTSIHTPPPPPANLTILGARAATPPTAEG